MPTFTGSQPPSTPPSPAGRTPAPPAETGPASERQLLHWLTASTIVLLLVGTIAFAWKERQRTLDEAGDVATRRVTRLVNDVEQSLAVARKAIEQAETRLRLRAPDGPLGGLAVGDFKRRIEDMNAVLDDALSGQEKLL